MPIHHLDRVKFATTTTGTGTINVGTTSGATFLSPLEAGASTGDIVDYLIEEGNDFEIGRGTLTSGSPWTMSRDTVFVSKVSGSVGTTKMSLLGNGLVRLIAAAEDMIVGPTTSITDGRPVLWDTNNRRLKQHTSALGTAAAENTGTSGANVPKMSTHNTWSAPQGLSESALTTATAWDGSAVTNLTATINGANFAIANPSVVPTAGEFVNIKAVFSTTHTLTFGNKFLGMTGVTPSNTSGKKDNFVFRSDGTDLHLVGYRLDVTA